MTTYTTDPGAEYRKWAEVFLNVCKELKQEKANDKKCLLLSFDLLWKWKVTMQSEGE